MDRRGILAGLTAGTATAVLGGGQARAGTALDMTSILLFNRTTGEWRVQVPASLQLPGQSFTGIDAARFANLTGCTNVRGNLCASTCGPRNAVFTVRGSATVVPSWEVVNFTGGRWVLQTSGNLTVAGTRWTPAGTLFDLPSGSGVALLGANQQAGMVVAPTNAATPTWFFAQSGVLMMPQSSIDHRYAFAAHSPGDTQLYGIELRNGGRLTQWSVFAAAGYQGVVFGQRWPFSGVSALPEVQVGHVYGPIQTSYGWVLLVYNRTTGVGDFVLLSGTPPYQPSALLLRAQLAIGWTHCVPFRFGFFFYHRTRRLAQMATLAPSVINPTAIRVLNGYLWRDQTLPDFTDVVGFA